MLLGQHLRQGGGKALPALEGYLPKGILLLKLDLSRSVYPASAEVQAGGLGRPLAVNLADSRSGFADQGVQQAAQLLRVQLIGGIGGGFQLPKNSSAVRVAALALAMFLE